MSSFVLPLDSSEATLERVGGKGTNLSELARAGFADAHAARDLLVGEALHHRLALAEHMNAESLRDIAALTGEKLPTRKADLAAIIVRRLAGDGLREVWQSLDELQKAAVAEAVHGDFSRLDTRRFRAKYGNDPDWGSKDQWGRNRTASPLRVGSSAVR